MKQTIAISTFAGMLARQSGYTTDFCEQFVNEMFRTVTDALKESETVTIKGLGTFSRDDEGNVSFSPDATFAADINAPFDCFEPELLGDEVTEDSLSEEDTPEAAEESVNNSDMDVDTVAEIEEKTTEADVNASESDTDTIQNETTEIVANTGEVVTEPESATEIPAAEIEVKEESDEPANIGSEESISASETEQSDTEEPAKKRNIWTFVCGVAVGCIIGAAATYFIIMPQTEQQTEPEIQAEINDEAATLGETEVEPVTLPDSVLIVETTVEVKDDIAPAVADTAIYDTVTSTLAQLSRKHFGSYEFWVYIYDENRDIISNPDRVEKGTRLRIPSKEKYGIIPGNKESINAALRRSQAISKGN